MRVYSSAVLEPSLLGESPHRRLVSVLRRVAARVMHRRPRAAAVGRRRAVHLHVVHADACLLLRLQVGRPAQRVAGGEDDLLEVVDEREDEGVEECGEDVLLAVPV